MRFDAAIIGAGAEGLTAAALLGRAGLRVVVIERHDRVGGRARLREIHPGFRTSPFVDDIAPIPAPLFRQLDLARRGAILRPRRFSLACWPGRHRLLSFAKDEDRAAARLLAEAEQVRTQIVARAMAEARKAEARLLERWRRRPAQPWPASDLAFEELAAAVGKRLPDGDDAAHLVAIALSGRSADPFEPGSALHLPSVGVDRERVVGGSVNLTDALWQTARDAGVEFALGLEASDVLRRNDHVVGVGLADGSDISATDVVSTLDIKRTFLGFFAWNSLSASVMRHVKAFRTMGATARVLFALDRRPASSPDVPLGAAIVIAPDLVRLSEAHRAWRAGVLAGDLPVTLRIVSDNDPALVPAGAALATATFGSVPFRLFDGSWTREKRALLQTQALAAAESVFPGFASCVLACEIVTPPDIEEALGATEGDLLGGELAGDQMLGCGPFECPLLPRTPVAGLYLAGSNLAAGAFATGVAGACAAYALLADRGA